MPVLLDLLISAGLGPPRTSSTNWPKPTTRNACQKTLYGYARYNLLCLDEFGCAPRGAEEPCGRRSPPLVIAVTGEAGDRPSPGSGVRLGAVSTT